MTGGRQRGDDPGKPDQLLRFAIAGRLESMAFRVWRAITKLVRLSGTSEHRDALREWVRQLIADSGQLP